MQQPLTIKYIDPQLGYKGACLRLSCLGPIRFGRCQRTPTIAPGAELLQRLPPSSEVYCSVLGAHAVHVAMAGYTGVVVGKVDERYVMLPNHAITKAPQRRVELKSSIFERLMATTGQPSLAPGPGDEWALLPPAPRPKYAKPMLATSGHLFEILYMYTVYNDVV